MADVEIKYNNATIASLSDSGTEVLETNGTFLTDDITVEYTKSGGAVQSMLVEITINEVAEGIATQIEMTAGDMKSALDQGISFVFWYPSSSRYVSLEYATKSADGTYVKNVKLTGVSIIFTASSESSKLQYIQHSGGTSD